MPFRCGRATVRTDLAYFLCSSRTYRVAGERVLDSRWR